MSTILHKRTFLLAGCLTLACWGVFFLAMGAAPATGAEIDPKVKSYEVVSGISGNLNGKGSDTLNNMMDLWLKAFMKAYPNVQGSYVGEGSSTAPPALIEGTAQLAPMSRAMKPEEEEAIEKKHGYKPTRLTVALDCLAVFVHKDNPVRGLTLPQVDCIFSQTRNSGFADISRWGKAGLADNADWGDLPISLYGRNSVSGTYGYFKKVALFKGDFKDSVKELPGSAAVVNAVASDRSGIGYSGIGYRTADVRALPLAKDGETPLAEPTFEKALSGDYPLGRGLFIYVLKKPNEPLPPLVQEFLRFVLSKEGQEIVVQDGFGPLPAAAIDQQLKLLK
jgi:phosphate transport system substrate-binding protein